MENLTVTQVQGGTSMKVSNKTIFMGDATKNERNLTVQQSHQKDKNAKGHKSFFAGDLNKNLDPIAQKKKEAQKKAMKVVSDVFANERKVDEDMDKRSQNIDLMKENIKEALEELKNIDAAKEELKKEYGVTEENSGNEEYQTRLNELNKNAEPLKEEIANAEKTIKMENAVIRGVKIERLKTHEMVDAQKQKDEILEAASDEIVGMLIEEGKEHVDEEQEKKQEEAEKLAEKEKADKEQIEAVKEKVEEMKEFVEGIHKDYVDEDETEEMDVSMYNVVELEQQRGAMKEEIENIVDKMSLVIEDIKGSCVDSKL